MLAPPPHSQADKTLKLLDKIMRGLEVSHAMMSVLRPFVSLPCLCLYLSFCQTETENEVL